MRTRIARMIRRIRGERPSSAQNPTRNPGCSEFEIDAWEISDYLVSRLVPIVGMHPFPLHELMLMCAAVCRLRPSQVYEWGTHVGKSARIFHECAKHYEIPLQIHSVDLPDAAEHVEHPGDSRGMLVRGLPNVHLHQGDGIEISISMWKTSGCPPAPLFFIDGDHAYESVHRELSTVVAEIPGASVLLHDTFFQSKASGYNVGPYQAIADVLKANPRRYRRIDSGLGLPGMTLLYAAAV